MLGGGMRIYFDTDNEVEDQLEVTCVDAYDAMLDACMNYVFKFTKDNDDLNIIVDRFNEKENQKKRKKLLEKIEQTQDNLK